jgi:hypothetical protein
MSKGLFRIVAAFLGTIGSTATFFTLRQKRRNDYESRCRKLLADVMAEVDEILLEGKAEIYQLSFAAGLSATLKAKARKMYLDDLDSLALIIEQTKELKSRTENELSNNLDKNPKSFIAAASSLQPVLARLKQDQRRIRNDMPKIWERIDNDYIQAISRVNDLMVAAGVLAVKKSKSFHQTETEAGDPLKSFISYLEMLRTNLFDNIQDPDDIVWDKLEQFLEEQENSLAR